MQQKGGTDGTSRSLSNSFERRRVRALPRDEVEGGSRAGCSPTGGGSTALKKRCQSAAGMKKKKSNGKIPEVARISRQRERGSVAGGAEGCVSDTTTDISAEDNRAFFNVSPGLACVKPLSSVRCSRVKITHDCRILLFFLAAVVFIF